MFFNETVLLIIIQKFNPHETVIFDDRNPPWITSRIKKKKKKKKKMINDKNLAFKRFVKEKLL